MAQAYRAAGQIPPWQLINWVSLMKHSFGWSFFNGKQHCY